MAKRTVDLKLVIAVLIGLVSVTGAAVAWKAAITGEYATDKDRQAIAETVTVEQARANRQVIVQDARERFADHAIAVVDAARLEEQARQASDAGDDERFRELRDDAIDSRVVGQRVLEGTLGPLFLPEYVTDGEPGEVPTFDEQRFRDDLDRIAAAEDRLDPVETIIQANRLRDDSERFDRWVIFMVGAVVLLTLAQISGPKLLRLGLTGAGTSVWLVSTVLAWSGS